MLMPLRHVPMQRREGFQNPGPKRVCHREGFAYSLPCFGSWGFPHLKHGAFDTELYMVTLIPPQMAEIPTRMA